MKPRIIINSRINLTNIPLNVAKKAVALAVLSCALASAQAQVLFFDDFNGPTLDPEWQTGLPSMQVGAFYGPATYIGAPTYSFQTLGGSSVIRMNENLAPQQRVGWHNSVIFAPSTFLYEARFNTLNQSSDTSIDAFVEIGLLDPSNTSRYDLVSPFGGSRSTDRRFTVSSSIASSYTSDAFNYANNTWYRLLIQGNAGQIRLSLDDDSGHELIGRTLNHGTGAFSSGFEIFLSQAMGIPLQTSPSDVAVDFVRLSVPEPSAAALLLLGGAIFFRRRCGKRSKIA